MGFFNQKQPQVVRPREQVLVEQSEQLFSNFVKVASTLTDINVELAQIEEYKEESIQRLMEEKAALVARRESNARLASKITDLLS